MLTPNHAAAQRGGALAALAAVTLVLAGCAGVPRGPAPSARQAASLAQQGNLAGAAQMYEALAHQSGGAQHNDFALEAARTYLLSRRPEDAARALRLLSAPLSSSEAFERSLLEVRLALQREQPARAWALLEAIAAPGQPDQARRYWRLRQQVAFAAGRPAAGVAAEIQLEHGLLNAGAVQQSRAALLDALRDAVERGVSLQPRAQSNAVIRGWLELGPLAAEAARNPTAATADLTAWLSAHPGHP